MKLLLNSLVVLSLYVSYSQSYFVEVEANSEECFFDKVKSGTKLGLTFEVAEGGFLDIDVRIMGPEPDAKPIHQGERETNGKYTFAADKDGVYRYCFSNKMSAVTPKVVMFTMDITEASAEHEGGDVDHNKLEEMIQELGTTLTGVKHEQEYMAVRDRIHSSINESSNSRVVLWSVFEAIVLCSMSIGQIYYLKRFFEVRRVV